MRNLIAKLTPWTHESAATLVGDVERPRILQQPGSKRAAGRLVMLGMAMVVALLLVALSSTQQPPVRINRRWLTQKPLEKQVLFMHEHAPELSNGDMLCPCLNRFQKTPNSYLKQLFFSFYLITNSTSYVTRELELHPERPGPKEGMNPPFTFKLCSAVLPHDSPYVNLTDSICQSLVQSVTGYLSLHYDDGAYLNPRLFLNRACTGLTVVVTNTWINAVKPNSTSTIEANVLHLVDEMWGSMLVVGTSWSGEWPPPEDKDYWNAIYGNPDYSLIENMQVNVRDVNRTGVFAMEVNWTMYYEFCGPSYCDELVKTSLGWKLIAGAAQVGGFLSLALVLLRALLWPTIQALIGWRSEPTRSLSVHPSSNQLCHLPEDTQNITLTESKSWS